MKELGRLLREARDAKGISLRELAEATKVRTKYLEAIERGEFSVIPGEIYLKGFLRAYGEHVGLGGRETVQRYIDMKKADEAEKLRAVQEERPDRLKRTKAKANTGATARFATALRLGTALLVLAIAVASGLFWVQNRDQDNRHDMVEPPIDNIVERPTEPGPEPEPAPPARDRNALSMSFLDRCWIKVWIGESVVREGFMNAGQEAVFEADTPIRVRVGNAGAVRVVFNGADLGVPGRRGEVREFELPGDLGVTLFRQLP